MEKINLLTLASGTEKSILVYREDYIARDIARNAQIVVPENFICYMIKDGQKNQPYLPGKYDFYNKKEDLSLLKLKKVVDTFTLVFVKNRMTHKLLWGTNTNSICDYDRSSNVDYTIRGNGECNFEIGDSDQFLKIAGDRKTYSVDELLEFVRSSVVSNIREPILETIAEEQYDLMQLGRVMDSLARGVQPKLAKLLSSQFGFNISNLIFNALDIDPDAKRRIKEYRQKARDKYESREDTSYENTLKERNEERQWEHESKLIAASLDEKEKYYDTVKIAGWQSQKSSNNSEFVSGGCNDGKGFIKVHKCPKCGKVANSKFCSVCGAKILNECKSCGNVNEGNGEFCENCGKKL